MTCIVSLPIVLKSLLTRSTSSTKSELYNKEKNQPIHHRNARANKSWVLVVYLLYRIHIFDISIKSVLPEIILL